MARFDYRKLPEEVRAAAVEEGRQRDAREKLEELQGRARSEKRERERSRGEEGADVIEAMTPIARVGLTAARAVRPNVRQLVRHPAQHAREKPAATALLIFVVLVTLAVLRRGALPDQRGLIAIGGAAFAVIVASTFLPDLTVAALMIGLVISGVENVGVINTVVEAGTARFQAALGKAA